jgi:hypothetical protein
MSIDNDSLNGNNDDKSDNTSKYSVDEIIKEAKNNSSTSSDDNNGSDFYDDSNTSSPAVDDKQADMDSPKKKKRHFWNRDKKSNDYNENDDAYYGLPVKPLSDLRRGFDSTGEITSEENTYANLFDNTITSLDEEMEKNFQRIQRERRRKVAEAVESAGVDADKLAEEMGVVAPMPVTSFSADPYAKQHGISPDISAKDESSFQKAIEKTAENDTMEIKLNVANSTFGLSKEKSIPQIDESSIQDIKDYAEDNSSSSFEDISSVSEQSAASYKPDNNEKISNETQNKESDETQGKQVDPVSDYSSDDTNTDAPKDSTDSSHKSPNTFADFPKISNVSKYRDKTVPAHMLNIDVLQSAILSETASYEDKDEKTSPFVRSSKKVNKEKETASGSDEDNNEESLSDYTSPQDAESISFDLRSSMRDLSLRSFVTGLSSILLFLITAIFERSYTGADGSANPAVYLILSVLFLCLSIGFCYKSLLIGLKKLIACTPNSDSGVAVAALFVLFQTVTAFLYPSKITSGSIHLYTSLVCLLIFLNSIGKLTMVRRIHSNFRFVTSREDKYAVMTYDDYNTALKLANGCVSGAPKIQYQKKAGFLKRFLQLSYEPDPSEIASQDISALGLVLSLVLTLISMFITKSVSSALAALAISSCVCVSATNMLATNLEISKLCKRSRRNGSMLVGYKAIEQVKDTNAVMMDASDLFPSGTVVLDGVKSFSTNDVEPSIISASYLIKQVGGPLSDIFDQVSNDDEAEHSVSNINYENENGVSGLVDGKLIIVGSRTILLNHGITPPERDDVIKYTVGGKKILFIAADGQLKAMLIIIYKSDRRKKVELQRLQDDGVSLIVHSSDPNITPKFISKLFAISSANINIITGELGNTYADLVKEEIPRADAVIATKGHSESMMNTISSCLSEKRIISLIVLLQTISVILGFCVIALLCCFSGISDITAIAVILYELFWTAVVLLIPKIKKF